MAKDIIPNSIQELGLTEFSCQQKNMTTKDANFQWTVPSSTKCLYMFLQDTTSGSSPIIPPSVFRVYGATAVAGTLPASIGCEQNLTTMQVTYANTTKPQTRWNTGMNTGSDYLVQLYMQSFIESDRDADFGGAETMDQWLQRGPCTADASNATRKTDRPKSKLRSATTTWPTSGANLFLVAEYERVTEITSSNGMIVNVRALNV